MQNKSFISVVIPIYKVEFFTPIVDSILGQTFKNIEVIFVNDGSPDNCPFICDDYAKKDTRVKVIHQENQGVGAASNLGIATAKGEYIAIVELNDWIEEDMYEIMYANAKLYDTDMTKCSFDRFNSTQPYYNSRC